MLLLKSLMLIQTLSTKRGDCNIGVRKRNVYKLVRAISDRSASLFICGKTSSALAREQAQIALN